MSQLTNVTLKDRTSGTPVSTVFAPVELLNGVGRLQAPGSSGTAIGQPVLTISGRRKNGGSKRTAGEMTIAMPKVVVEIINGVQVPRVIGTSYIRVSTDIDPNFTDQDLENFQGWFEDSQKTAQALIKNALFKRENVYG